MLTDKNPYLIDALPTQLCKQVFGRVKSLAVRSSSSSRPTARLKKIPMQNRESTVEPILMEPGKDSKEKDIQYPREKGILQAHYFSRSIIISSKMNVTTSFSTCNTNTQKALNNDINHVKTVVTGNNATNRKFDKIKSGLFDFETDLIWYIVLQLLVLHIIGIYGLLTFDYIKNPMTTLWILGMYIISNFGVSAGAHRYYTHKSYKAKLPLRILFLIFFNACGQNTMCNWVKNHRMHHKYCDTNADPHNSKRGFFYSHVGWVMMMEHPEFTEKSKTLDLSDIMSDPVVAFGEKYFLSLQLFFAFILPTTMPVYLWNETWTRAIMSQVFIRYMITLNSVWTINSIAHVWGTRPYDKTIKPRDNEIVNFLTVGEGYHNYHHVFPWDYRSAEKGCNKMNYTTFFIDIFAKLGLAYDLKYPSIDLIKKIILNKGDGTHHTLSEVPMPK